MKVMKHTKILKRGSTCSFTTPVIIFFYIFSGLTNINCLIVLYPEGEIVSLKNKTLINKSRHSSTELSAGCSQENLLPCHFQLRWLTHPFSCIK